MNKAVDTVTAESRPMVEALMKDAAAKAMPRGRQIRHAAARGADIPVVASAVQVEVEGCVVAVVLIVVPRRDGPKAARRPAPSLAWATFAVALSYAVVQLNALFPGA